MRLTDSFIDLIAYVAYFTSSSEASGQSYDQVRTDIDRLIQASGDMAETQGVSHKDYDLARFAVCAWIDESIMASAWDHRLMWQRTLLQKAHYRTTDGGILFFDRLKDLGPDQNDIREVYYLCIALGFSGKFCLDGDAVRLDQLQSTNSKLLTGSARGALSIEGNTLFPASFQLDENGQPVKQTRQTGTMAWAAICAAPVVIFTFMFFIYRFILNNEIVFKM